MLSSRAGTKKHRLRTTLLELLAEHERDGALPTSNRFLFYELVQRGLISKQRQTPGRRPDQDMNDALTSLREDGSVPWEWIVDETRSMDSYSGHASIKEGLEARLKYVRLDPWAGDVPLTLTESRSLAGVLRDLCIDYCVDIAATNGQVGGFLHTGILPMLEPMHRILYLGDYDLAGSDIEANTRSVLVRIGQGKVVRRLPRPENRHPPPGEERADHQLVKCKLRATSVPTFPA
jgi:hypothetical protein